MGAGQNGNGIKSIAHDRIRNSSENAKGSNRHFNGQIQSLRIGTLNPITILQHIYNRLSTLHGHCALHKERAGNKIDQLQCIQIRRTRQMILTHETQAMIWYIWMLQSIPTLLNYSCWPIKSAYLVFSFSHCSGVSVFFGDVVVSFISIAPTYRSTHLRESMKLSNLFRKYLVHYVHISDGHWFTIGSSPSLCLCNVIFFAKLGDTIMTA